MKLNQVFPSNYLKADDLQGREAKVTIRDCKMEKMGDEDKLCIHFVGKDKGMICNKTNANRIAHYFGDDTDGWIGKQIILGVELVDFQGKTTEAIRVKGKVEGVAAPVADAPFDDSIPF
jgi:hypothetical protein